MSVAIKRTASRQPDYNIVVIDDISAQKQAEADASKLRDALQEKLALQSQKVQQGIEALQMQGNRAMEAGEALRESQATLRDKEAALRDKEAALRDKEAALRAAQQSLAEKEQMLRAAEQPLAEKEEALRACRQSLHDTQETLRDTQEALRDAEDRQREAQSALQAANSKLAAESATDSLTVLPNRRSFSRRGEQAANALRQSRKPYGLILLDLDNLKSINDEYGHDVGDQVLRALGNMLGTQLRNSSDMAARLGGDEFAVLCFGDINEQTLHDVAERVQTQMAKEPLATSKGLLRFTGSFGLALSQADDPDWKTVYGRADAALREAKAAGKDRISFGRSQSKSGTARLRALSVTQPAG
jgi:diguanylate cyclase (GGDEF)-like protein